MEPFFLNFWFPLLLIFARIVAFVVVLPFFAWRGIPIMLRVFFAFIVSVLLTLDWEGALNLPESDLEMILLLSREILVGLLLGFLVYLFFSIFLMSGQFMDHKAGLMMAGSFDPLLGGQVTILGQFFYFLAVVLYLTMNGHHLLFFSLKESLLLIPLEGPFIGAQVLWDYIKIFPRMFLLAFQIAAPVIIILWITDIALGFLSKTVPQIHVFIVGLPLKIALVLLVFLFTIPLLGGVLREVFDLLARDFVLVMRSWIMS